MHLRSNYLTLLYNAGLVVPYVFHSPGLKNTLYFIYTEQRDRIKRQ